MADLPTSLKLIWIASSVLQIAILVLVLVRRHYQTLPKFAWYIGLNLAQSLLMAGMYSRFGFTSTPSYRTYWATEAIIMVVQTIASTEVLHRALQDYPGVWALTWRVILFASVVVIGIAGATANRNDQWGLWAVTIGYYVTFAVAFVICLLLIRRYSIAIDPVYRMLVGGYCFYACASIFADALLKSQYLAKLPGYAIVWNYLSLWVFLAVLAIWIVALRNPVRVPVKPDSALSGCDYETLGPQVNSRLRELNDTLRKFFRRQVVES